MADSVVLVVISINQQSMIRAIFTTANNVAKRFRYSPTAIIEGRQLKHLETRIAQQQQQELQTKAADLTLQARIANTTCPYERERLEILREFRNPSSNLEFVEAARRIDEVDQRQAGDSLKQFWEEKKWRE